MQNRILEKIFVILCSAVVLNASTNATDNNSTLSAIDSFEVIEQQQDVLEDVEDIERWVKADQVVIEGLDKITARVFTAKVLINQLVRFGTLELYVRAAYRTPPEEVPDSACFLEIYDCKPGEEKEMVFSGWMFASNPALSALEHAVYDVWVKDALLRH